MRMMLLLMEACSAASSGEFTAHSSSRPSRAPAVVATVSGASVLIVGANAEVELPMGEYEFAFMDMDHGEHEHETERGGEKKKKSERRTTARWKV